MAGNYYNQHDPDGISAVVQYWSRYIEDLQYYPTYKLGSVATRACWFISSYLRMALRMLTDRNIKIVHLHTAADGSFWRKVQLIRLAKRMRRKVILHVHASRFKDFYEESNGGITISGGEGMSQPAFLFHLVNELKKHQLHLAIETTGYIEHELFTKLAPLFDLLLFDVKHYDREQHFLGTGVYNDLIIKNLKWALQNKIEVLPRIPVIPDFNDSLNDAKGLARLLKNIGVLKVQLLPFHQFGEKKYEMLNLEYSLKNKKALHKEDLKEYQNIFINEDIKCFF